MDESTMIFNNLSGLSDSGINDTNSTLPPGMTFNNQSLTVVIIYCICFIIAAIGNLTVFITLSRGRYRKSRISLMICHLSAADLLVTFVMIPIEIGWRLTVQWTAGNMACKIFSFLRAFGLYLSSNILVCVSLDRYFAVLHPLRVTDARRRGKIMLIIAWICSIIYAVPQCFIFRVSTHPEYPDYQQCVTFDSGVHEAAYTAFCVLAMYFIPLGIICWAYTKILCEISSKSRESDQVIPKSNSTTYTSNGASMTGSRVRLRRSDMSSMERARSRTLRMTITIVAVFILCWTPYVAMLLWYTLDRASAESVDPRLQQALFIMAVANSCANPLVYGSYAIDFRKECCRCFLPYSTAPNADGLELVQRNTGKKVHIARVKTPGVSSVIVQDIRHAVFKYFRVSNIRTRSTGTGVSGNEILPTPSPKLVSKSISTKSLQIHDQKHERMNNFLSVPDEDVRISPASAIKVVGHNG